MIVGRWISTSVSKKSALSGLDHFIKAAIEQHNVAALDIYLDAWKTISGNKYPVPGDEECSIQSMPKV